jgi:plastocyanin
MLQMKTKTFWALACLVGSALVAACGGGGGTGGSGSGSGGSTSSSTGGGGMVNGCDPSTTMLTTGDATITFPTTAAPAQYSPNCVKIKAGSKVTWNGDFSMHPLTGSAPIMDTMTGMSASFTFPTAGTFAFNCQFHPSIMLGAVIVE